eukprot:1022540-Pyramimonas_sp.AAC.1
MVQGGLQDGQHAVEDCQVGPAWPPRRPKMPSKTASIARKGVQVAPSGLQKPAGSPKMPPRGTPPSLTSHVPLRYHHHHPPLSCSSPIFLTQVFPPRISTTAGGTPGPTPGPIFAVTLGRVAFPEGKGRR